MNKSKNNSSNIGNNNSDMEYPKFEELKDIFDNNVKIYNNFVEGNLANFSQNKTTQTNNSSKKEFSTMDLLNSISPTTNKILESFQKSKSKSLFEFYATTAEIFIVSHIFFRRKHKAHILVKKRLILLLH